MRLDDARTLLDALDDLDARLADIEPDSDDALQLTLSDLAAVTRDARRQLIDTIERTDRTS